MNRKVRWLLGVSVAIALGSVFAGVPIGNGCPLRFEECRGTTKPSAPAWEVPVSGNESAAYKMAHALPLPAAAPAAVPFDFKQARRTDFWGGKSVAQQYFEHLCSSEDGTFVSRTVQDVDGFAMLRPRGPVYAALDHDRVRPEEPTGFGWFSEDNSTTETGDLVAARFVQPLFGLYQYVELVEDLPSTRVVRVERDASTPSSKYPYGLQTWNQLTVPYISRRSAGSSMRSHYGYTWRGIHRDRDREFGIAGGEFLIIDLSTNEVLAVRRVFNSTHHPANPGFTSWSSARACSSGLPEHSAVNFLVRVLRPNLRVNDAFVPSEQMEAYRAHVISRIEDDNDAH